MHKIVIACNDTNDNRYDNLLVFLMQKLLKIGKKVFITDYSKICNDCTETDVQICMYTKTSNKPETCFKRDIISGVFILEDHLELTNKFVHDWVGTPHLRVIKNNSNQLKCLLDEIYHLIGYPNSYEIERKFLIKLPKTEFLDSLQNCASVEISQTYIKRGINGENIRVRQRGKEKDSIYFKTVKKKLTETTRFEDEYIISREQYKEELLNADLELKPINKIRYCLLYKYQYFEIDIFPFWKNQAYAEIELLNENDNIEFPKYIDVIKEVTYDKKYTNHSLAKNIPIEN